MNKTNSGAHKIRRHFPLNWTQKMAIQAKRHNTHKHKRTHTQFVVLLKITHVYVHDTIANEMFMKEPKRKNKIIINKLK